MQLDAEGHAVLPGLLGADVARSLAQQTMAPGANSVTLESGDLGRGELFYFGAGMPAPLEQWRSALYRRLVTVANRWNKPWASIIVIRRNWRIFCDTTRRQARRGRNRI